jgi:hypothetical protein
LAIPENEGEEAGLNSLFVPAASPSRPTSLELCEQFLRLEEDENLFEKPIQQTFFWEHVRYYVFLELQRTLGLIGVQPFSGPNRVQACIRKMASGFQAMFSRNPFWTTSKPLMFFGCPRRSPDEAGVWWDTSVDPYLDALSFPAYYIERYNHDRHYTPTRTRDVKYHDLFAILAGIYRLATFYQRFTPGESTLLQNIEQQLKNQFNAAIDVTGITRSILKTRRCLLGMYRRLLRQVRPEMVFFASINYFERISIEACKEVGLPTVEIQHGVIGPTDLCYVYPRGVSLRCFPDYLLVYGPFWQQCVRYPLPQERVLAVGNPYLEAQAQRERTASPGESIVFISGAAVGGELSRFAARLADHPRLNVPIVYRLHPFELDWQTRYPWLKHPRILISENRQENLYAVLVRAKAQVGVNSAALFEGLAFGLRTFLLDLPGIENMEPLLRKGYARRVSEPAEVFEDVSSRPGRIDRDYFFSPGALQRFAQIVEDIRSKAKRKHAA